LPEPCGAFESGVLSEPRRRSRRQKEVNDMGNRLRQVLVTLALAGALVGGTLVAHAATSSSSPSTTTQSANSSSSSASRPNM
jgi:hypothetical protein